MASTMHTDFLNIIGHNFDTSDDQSDACYFVTEHRFSSERKYRFDYCWPNYGIAIELNGGIYTGRKGHSSIKGLERDYEKLNLAQSLGWIVLQFSAAQIRDSSYVVAVIKSCINLRGIENA